MSQLSNIDFFKSHKMQKNKNLLFNLQVQANQVNPKCNLIALVNISAALMLLNLSKEAAIIPIKRRQGNRSCIFIYVINKLLVTL